MSVHSLDAELEDGIAMEIMHVARRIHWSSTRELEKLNIGAGQIPILKTLQDHTGITQRQIAESLRVTPATISTTIRRMERAGLVERIPSDTDARATCVSLTEYGRKCCCKAMAYGSAVYDQMLRGFSDDECRQLQDYIRRIDVNLSSTAQEEKENEDRLD